MLKPHVMACLSAEGTSLRFQACESQPILPGGGIEVGFPGMICLFCAQNKNAWGCWKDLSGMISASFRSTYSKSYMFCFKRG